MQIIVAELLLYDLPVIFTYEKDTDIALHGADIIDDITGHGLPESEFVLFEVEVLNKLRECFYRKRVMLSGYAKASLPLAR